MSDTLKTGIQSPTADQTVEAANSAVYDTATASAATNAEEAPAFGPPGQAGEVGKLGPVPRGEGTRPAAAASASGSAEPAQAASPSR